MTKSHRRQRWYSDSSFLLKKKYIDIYNYDGYNNADNKGGTIWLIPLISGRKTKN